MFDEQMVHGDVLIPEDDAVRRVRFKLRLPWYRSLPLSCIQALDVNIDGQRTASDALLVRLNGQDHTLAEAASLHDTWWFVLDPIEVHAKTATSLAPGSHRVGVALTLRIPYIDPDFSLAHEFVQVAHASRDLTLVGKDF